MDAGEEGRAKGGVDVGQGGGDIEGGSESSWEDHVRVQEGSSLEQMKTMMERRVFFAACEGGLEASAPRTDTVGA